MRYKALMIDVDGTLVPNHKNGMPSQKVIDAIAKASKFIHIGIATSRPLFRMKKIFRVLSLSGPSIINSGSQIIDVSSYTIHKEYILSSDDVSTICEILEEFHAPIIIHDDTKDIKYFKRYRPKKPLNIGTFKLSQERADEIINHISLPTVSVYKVPDWTKGKVGIIISHAQATKQHGILEVAQILNIKTHEIIGIGDGYNDFPLLMACGLKIAMGNAVSDLKEIADYIAPSVEQDGVSDVINKFMLPSKA